MTLESGEVVSDLNFGNREDDLPPPGVIIDDPLVDFDGDGQMDAPDIDLLAAAIRSGKAEASAHDLSGDGLVDAADYRFLVETLMQTHFGDANLDGTFNSSDLVLIFQGGKYEDGIEDNATWAEGDFNGDGEFTTADLVAAFQSGAYDSGAGAISAAAADEFWQFAAAIDE